MGSGESTTRKVSFGVDDEDRVRILRGVKLTEEVLQRMKGVANIAPEKTSAQTTSPQKDTGSSPSASPISKPKQSAEAQAKAAGQSSTNKPDPKDAHKKGSEKQQSNKKEKAPQKDKENSVAAMSRERHNAQQESENTKKLVQQLQKKDAQLKTMEAFYKEQIAQMEQKTQGEYQQSKEQFHQAASKTEEIVRARNTLPLCSGLQAQLFSCYTTHKEQTLRCSDLAKQYMRCIHEAKQNPLVNHG